MLTGRFSGGNSRCIEDGALLSGVEVRFYSNSRLQAVAQTGADGIAKVELKAGEYVVDVRNFANTFELDTEKTYKVTESETEIEIKLLIKTNDIKYNHAFADFPGAKIEKFYDAVIASKNNDVSLALIDALCNYCNFCTS